MSDRRSHRLFHQTSDGKIQRGDIVEVWDDPKKKIYGVFDCMGQIEGQTVYSMRTFEPTGEERRVTCFRHNIRFVARMKEEG